jgi:hypothetical protein
MTYSLSTNRFEGSILVSLILLFSQIVLLRQAKS